MLIYIIFMVLFLFVLAYYFAFEAYRYRTAKMLSEALDGRPVFKLGGSYMRRNVEGGEERVWIVPDDKMAWGSLLSIAAPPMGKLYLCRKKASGFRFRIEPRTGVLFRTISGLRFKEALFNEPLLDKSLRMLADDRGEAGRYFASPEKRDALKVLFQEGIMQIEGGGKGVTATLFGISAADVKPPKIDLLFGQLRRLSDHEKS